MYLGYIVQFLIKAWVHSFMKILKRKLQKSENISQLKIPNEPYEKTYLLQTILSQNISNDRTYQDILYFDMFRTLTYSALVCFDLIHIIFMCFV